MANISYTYIPPQAVLANKTLFSESNERIKSAGGFNPDTNTFIPLSLEGRQLVYGPGEDIIPGYALFKTISAAVEAGIVDEEMWPSQLFANVESYLAFVSVLRDYEECFKLVDPWWCALRALLGQPDEEEGYSTAADLAERFVEVLDELPEQWADE